MTRILKRGAGWRVGYDPNADPFVGLVGSDDWAIELTAEELSDLQRLLPQLCESIAAIAPELMDEERITCEVESDRLWMEADGEPNAYRIRLILHSGRRCEGEWRPDAVPDLLQAVKMLEMF